MDLIEEILRAGEKQADEVEVYISEAESVSADLKRTHVETASGSKGFGIGIRVIAGGRIGVSSTGSPRDWRACLDAACASARLAHPQEWGGLPSPAALPPVPPIRDPRVALDPAWARNVLEEMLEGAGEHDAAVTGGSASASQSRIRIANTSGVLYEQERTSVGCSIECINERSTGYEFDASPYLEIDPRRTGERAAFFAEHGAVGEEIESGNYDLVLSPVALTQLLSHVLEPALSGRNVHAGRSWLAGKLGEECIGENLSIMDDPSRKAPGSTRFDAEGVPARRITFFDGGVLEAYAYDLRTAYRYGQESSGSAVRGGPGGAPSIGIHTLVIDGRRDTVDDDPAVYVHDLIGAHTANPITGDFSVELSNASWVADGEFETPVRSAMFAGNVFDLLSSVAAIDRDERIVGTAVLPRVRLNSQHIIGK
ncbi:TldD/PmbA family protein [Methanofollis fontis]|nr:TldD/PmbA family protein [Methanofollis fontis]